MNINWFKNPDHIVYAPVEEFADNFGKETGIPDLRKKLDEFKADPGEGSVNIKGQKRTMLKLFIPNMVFDEEIEMGDTVWVYMGENYEAYCLYWPQ